MIGFIIGLFIGSTIGVFAMALIVGGKTNERYLNEGDLISKRDVIDFLNMRDKELADIYGNLGGACSGVRRFVEQLPTYHA